MSWMSGINDLLQQYSNVQPNQAPDTVEDDFDQMAQAAPPDAVADGLSAAFRDERTPPFPNMLGQIFAQSSGQQRAGILNSLIAALGPAVLQQILARRGGGGGAGDAGGGNFGGIGGGGGGGGFLDQILGQLGGGAGGGGGEALPQITPEQAEQISPEVVEQAAAEAERRDPSIIERVSDVYARQPTLIKVLGGAALAVALSKIAERSLGTKGSPF
jgi:hypothetical protein